MTVAQSTHRAHPPPMRWMFLLFGFMLALSSSALAGSSPPQATLRVHIQTAGEGMSAQESTTIPVPPDGEQIQVRTLPEVSERDIIDLKQDAAGLHIQFNHIGMVNLNAATGQNQGRILVVMVDGRVIYAPTIDEQISNGHLDIPHQIPLQVVEALQKVAEHNVREAAR